MSLRRMCRKRVWKMSLRDPVFALLSVGTLSFHNKIFKKMEKALMEMEKRPILYDVKGNKIPVDGVLLRAQRNTNTETGKFQ